MSSWPRIRVQSIPAIADIHGTRTGDEMFVVENVPGMKKFPVVMEAMTKLPDYYVSVVCPGQIFDVAASEA